VAPSRRRRFPSKLRNPSIVASFDRRTGKDSLLPSNVGEQSRSAHISLSEQSGWLEDRAGGIVASRAIRLQAALDGTNHSKE
jgi:hypothetical protein